MKWIISNGGPLVCFESKWKTSWGGIDRLTNERFGAANDYDRACECAATYSSTIPIGNDLALVLGGELGADTSIWRTPARSLLIVQVPCAVTGVNEDAYLKTLDESIFANPIDSAELTITSDEMILFDAAEPGNDIRFGCISFQIDPSHYRILTQTFDPSPEISFLLYKFERIAL